MDYKKIREAAMAYYANLSNEEQLKAWEFFKSIDTDGNGTISCSEYHSSLAKMGYTDPQNAFKMLDKNGDGVLDYGECITLFYIIAVHHGAVSCNGCGIYLWDIYFVCVGCYEAGGNTYDLCCDCYRKKNFEHQNAVFCDNITLLKRMQPTATSASQVKTSKGGVSKREIIKEAVENFELGYKIGTIGAQTANAATVVAHSASVHAVATAAVAGCTIM